MADTASLVARVKTEGVEAADRQLESFASSANTATAATNKLTPAVSQMDKAASKAASGGLSKTRSVAQQAGYQLQDFVVQVQSGTSALVALGQQGSQIAGAFGPTGAIVGAVIALGTAIAGVALASRNAERDIRALEAAASRIFDLRVSTLVDINDATRDFASAERLASYKALGESILDLTTKYENQRLETEQLRKKSQEALDAMGDIGGFFGPTQEEASAKLREAQQRLNESIQEEASIRSQLNGIRAKQDELLKAEAEAKLQVEKATTKAAKAAESAAKRQEKQQQADARRFELQKQQAQAYIEQLQRDNDDELTLVEKQEQDKLAIIADYRQRSLITDQEYEASRNEIARTARDERLSILEEEARSQSELQISIADAAARAEEEKTQRVATTIDALNSIYTTFGGNMSRTYKAMFAASKIYAQKDAIVQQAGALAKAWNSAPFPANLGAVGSTLLGTAPLLATIATTTFSAREQGGETMAGRAYNMAEKGKAEVIVPSSNSRVRTAQQMRQIMGESGNSKPSSISIINQTTGRVDQVDQQYDNDNNLILTIREVVANDLADSNSRISKTRTQTRNMAGFA